MNLWNISLYENPSESLRSFDFDPFAHVLASFLNIGSNHLSTTHLSQNPASFSQLGKLHLVQEDNLPAFHSNEVVFGELGESP